MSGGHRPPFNAFRGHGQRLDGTPVRPSAAPCPDVMVIDDSDGPVRNHIRAPDPAYHDMLIPPQPRTRDDQGVSEADAQFNRLELRDYKDTLLGLIKGSNELKDIASSWHLELPEHRYTENVRGKVDAFLALVEQFMTHVSELIHKPVEGISIKEIQEQAVEGRRVLGNQFVDIKSEVDFVLGRAPEREKRLARAGSDASSAAKHRRQPKAKASREKTKPPEETPVEAIAEDQPRTQKGKHAKAISPVPVGAQCTIIPWASYQAQQARPEDGVIQWASKAAPKRARSEPEEPTLQRSKYRLPKTSIEPTGSAGSTDAPEFNICHG